VGGLDIFPSLKNMDDMDVNIVINTNIIIIARAKGVASDKIANNYYFKTIS